MAGADQSREEIHDLVRAAILERRPISAMYHGQLRSARTCWVGASRVACRCSATSTAEVARADCGPKMDPPTGAAWLCKDSATSNRGTILGKRRSSSIPRPASNRSKSRWRVGRRQPAIGTVRKLPKQVAGNRNAERGDGARIMPFGTHSLTRAVGSPGGFSGRVVAEDRDRRRLKNGSSRLPGTHTRRCIK